MKVTLLFLFFVATATVFASGDEQTDAITVGKDKNGNLEAKPEVSERPPPTQPETLSTEPEQSVSSTGAEPPKKKLDDAAEHGKKAKDNVSKAASDLGQAGANTINAAKEAAAEGAETAAEGTKSFLSKARSMAWSPVTMVTRNAGRAKDAVVDGTNYVIESRPSVALFGTPNSWRRWALTLGAVPTITSLYSLAQDSKTQIEVKETRHLIKPTVVKPAAAKVQEYRSEEKVTRNRVVA